MTTVNETEAKELFSLFDRDGNGKIDARELGTLIRSLGENPTETEVQAMIKSVDDNKNGVLEFSEFMELIRNQTFERINKDDLINIFRAFDKDNTGKLLGEDVKQIVISGGEKLTPQEADEILEDFMDSEGYIAYEDFAEKLLAK
jgi:Ca2+-binding EF-hand superfamily protein